jgi:hypothetical protein
MLVTVALPVGLTWLLSLSDSVVTVSLCGG